MTALRDIAGDGRALADVGASAVAEEGTPTRAHAFRRTRPQNTDQRSEERR